MDKLETVSHGLLTQLSTNCIFSTDCILKISSGFESVGSFNFPVASLTFYDMLFMMLVIAYQWSAIMQAFVLKTNGM